MRLPAAVRSLKNIFLLQQDLVSFSKSKPIFLQTHFINTQQQLEQNKTNVCVLQWQLQKLLGSGLLYRAVQSSTTNMLHSQCTNEMTL